MEPASVTLTIDPSSELSDVLDAILRDLGQVVEYDHGRVMLLPSVLDYRMSAEDEISTLLITVRDRGSLDNRPGRLDPLQLDRYPLNRQLMTEQKPIVLSNAQAKEAWLASEGSGEAIQSWIGAPLVVKGESIGVLTINSVTPRAYTEKDGIIVFAFASQAAEAIDKVRLLDQAQNRLHEIGRAHV